MSHLSFFICSLFISCTLFSQKKWDGGGGNNLWSNALNWSGNTLPSTTDDIVLDNSLASSSYTIVLPSTAVTVKTITITPGTSRTIELTLPASNTLVPGLTVNGPGYGMVVNSGGTFRNSSGSTSGNAVVISDSIRINNDGRYVHNSASSHASNVQVLSRIAGTESGIMELDIPSASSTISISGRTFGKFVLRAVAAGGACNYTAAGTSKVAIRNTLDIGTGVNLNLNCSDTIFVGGDFLQETGTLNLGNSTRSVVFSIRQNITQNTGGVITETGTGTQTILINGTGLQLVVFRGTISNQVAMVKDGTGTALLKSAVSLPYKLVLKSGRMVTTQGLITLQSSCSIEADTLSGVSFVDGPLKKDGLANQSFLFPIGKSSLMRWVQLQNATGNFTIEYFRSDPHVISGNIGTGVHHISEIEYWDINTSGTSVANVKLSFDDPASGGVTNLSSLRVARLINGTWEDAGNVAVSGSPGADGWVSSNAAGGFSAGTKSFALASAMGQENPLPLSLLTLNVKRNGSGIIFNCIPEPDMKISGFELQRSYDGINYSPIYSKGIDPGVNIFSYTCIAETSNVYYRLIAWADDDIKCYTSNIILFGEKRSVGLFIVGSNIVSDVIRLSINDVNPGPKLFVIFDHNGRMVKTFREKIHSSPSLINLNISELSSGIYFIRGISGKNHLNTLRFMKK